MLSYHFRQNGECEIYPCSNSNRTTKEHYYAVLSQINDGTIRAAVCEVYNTVFGTTDYHIISKK